MAINALGQAHVTQPELVPTQTTQKTQNALNAAPKTNTANAANVAEPNGGAATASAVAAENNAGREQGNRQNTDTETRGTQVNVYA
jgi:hypothetical protein